MRDVAARTGGKFKFNPGTLYTNIKRLMLDGWIVESEERPEPEEDDERRRYYRITPQGRAAAEAELRRLQEIVADAAAVLFAKG
jgi:DNA-binding PadR family transcriptional regulator